ncbi:HERV-H LTR-associating protein 2 isoform X2 [Alligator mississippiensis]|uniref:HERV-H LTR-associating protein 2 isoform X2 n=1 Tax=Alligator mississippiensis TaxID=8496 RepID=UPI000711FE7D|nr:HERV-H LTR-associating protein 2 isoform X2 [Alligator mississippiensis]
MKVHFHLIFLLHACTIVLGLEIVTGQVSKDCILPCSFPRGEEVVIHWKKELQNVHSYYSGQDQLASQDSQYRGRTALFHEGIPNGNASLKLSKLHQTDEGSYSCYVGTKQTRTEVEVKLSIQAPPHYAMEYEKQDSERQLKCSAFLGYPKPNIIWQDCCISREDTRTERTQDGLYSVRSEKNITDKAYSYVCHIQFGDQIWTADWKRADLLCRSEGGTAIIPCEVSAESSSYTITLKAIKSTSTSVLASFNSTSRSPVLLPERFYLDTDKPHKYKLKISGLTLDDQGEYLCNVSTPQYTKLTITTLQVERTSTNSAVSGTGIGIGIVIGIVITVIGGISYYLYKKGHPKQNRSAVKTASPSEEPVALLPRDKGWTPEGLRQA